jgi:very-short-patch-repair endonuclease
MAYQTEKALNRARALRKNETAAEQRLWEELRGSRLNGFKFVRQLPIGPYFADFACRRAKLIVEVDGATHGDAHEVVHDEKRTMFLSEQGWVVHRVWNDDVFKERNAACDGILLALNSRLRGPHQPVGTFSHSPRGGREKAINC